MKKSETIALYIEEFLEGRSEEERQRFHEKDLAKQYSSIMAWKRRRDLASNADNLSSVTSMFETLKKIRKAIPNLEVLPQKDADKLRGVLNEIHDDINNFDRIKKGQLLRELENEREKIARQGENIDRQIEALRQELY